MYNIYAKNYHSEHPAKQNDHDNRDEKTDTTIQQLN